MRSYRKRRIAVVVAALVAAVVMLMANPKSWEEEPAYSEPTVSDGLLASTVLEQLEVKGRAPKTGYARDEFYGGWPTVDGCSLRQRIIKREFGETARFDADDDCTVIAGEYDEPYTGEHQVFAVKTEISKGVQIDHVVALSDAWQKGAQLLSAEERYSLATDPLNLLAVDASTNQKKSDGDAATWLPPNKAFRCAYVARQISVKYKYHLWVTEAEKAAMLGVLEKCPSEPAVGIDEVEMGADETGTGTGADQIKSSQE